MTRTSTATQEIRVRPTGAKFTGHGRTISTYGDSDISVLGGPGEGRLSCQGWGNLHGAGLGFDRG